MIGSVTIGGAAIALSDVFASVTIRHGRHSADDAPMASTCSLVLVNVTRELSSGFEVGDELAVLLDDGSARFVGRITDASLTDAGLSIVATSSLAQAAGRKIGLVDWPEELWSDRVHRVLGEAGLLTTWATIAGTWGASTGTWAAPVAAPPVTFEPGDDDPLVAARAAAETTVGAYLATLLADVPTAIANLPNGSVLVQALSARQELPLVALDPLLVAYVPELAMVDDVTNVVTVKYAGGASVTATDEQSREDFEDHPLSIETDLVSAADATSRASLAVSRRARPAWLMGSVELLDLEAAVSIGSPVAVGELPAYAPDETYLGLVEGWEDHVEPADGAGLDWRMELLLSDPRLSGYGLLWSTVPVTSTWAEASTATWARPSPVLAH